MFSDQIDKKTYPCMYMILLLLCLLSVWDSLCLCCGSSAVPWTLEKKSRYNIVVEDKGQNCELAIVEVETEVAEIAICCCFIIYKWWKLEMQYVLVLTFTECVSSLIL